MTNDRPQLTLTGGIARRSATDELGNEFIEFEADTFADQSAGECSNCGAEIESGWLCLDGGDEYCDDCVDVTEES